MADEILTTTTGAIVAEVASQYVHMLLADRASLRNHPALINLGPNLFGSDQEQVTSVGLDGYDLMTSRTEIQAVSNTALTTAAGNVTVAPYRLAYEHSDLVAAVSPFGFGDSARMALSIAMSASMTLTNLIAQAGDGLTQVGSTGVDFTHDTFLSGQFALKQALVEGPYLAVLKPKAFTDWQSDLESRGGVTQWRASTEQMMMLRGPGVEGSYNNVEVFTSDQVQGINANADWGSYIFGRGCLGYKELRMGPPPRSQFVLLDVEGVIRVAEARSETTGETQQVGHYNAGTIVIEAARGRTFVSAQ